MILSAVLSISRSFSLSYSLDSIILATKSSTINKALSGSTNKSLVKLNAEVSKRQAIRAYTNADVEEKLKNQRERMKALITEEESKVRSSLKEYECVRMKIAAKENIIKDYQNHCQEIEKTKND